MKIFKNPFVVFGMFALLVTLIAFGFIGTTFLRSDDYSFTQLMGGLDKGRSKLVVQWLYFEHRSSTMQMDSDPTDVWRARGRWQGELSQLAIHFAGGRVERLKLESQPPVQSPAPAATGGVSSTIAVHAASRHRLENIR